MKEPESHSEREASARLIAAGEKDIDTILYERELLLAACKALVGDFASDDDYRAAVAEAKAAVEKADGR